MKPLARALIAVLTAFAAAMPQMPAAMACAPAAAVCCCCSGADTRPACPRSHSCEMTGRLPDPSNVLPVSDMHVSKAPLAERLASGAETPFAGDRLAAGVLFARTSLDPPVPKRYLRTRSLRL